MLSPAARSTVEEPDQEAPDAPDAGRPSRGVPPGAAVRRAEVSRWRWPSAPGELPSYVQRSFRFKTFGLLGLQLLVVLAIMAGASLFLEKHRGSSAWMIPPFAFYFLGFLALCGLLFLNFARETYPLNYVALAGVTLLVGAFWGTTRLAFDTWLHFQVIGILCVTMLVAAVVSALCSLRKMEPWSLLLGSLLSGWAVASAADFFAVSLAPPELGVRPDSALFAVCLSLLLMLAVLVLDAGPMLVKCNPDDFMRVIISMDSALLIVVSVPIFLLSCCVLHTWNLGDQAIEEAGEVPLGLRGGPLGAPEV